jgi:exodeoxyribonuclease VII large subunit
MHSYDDFDIFGPDPDEAEPAWPSRPARRSPLRGAPAPHAPAAPGQQLAPGVISVGDAVTKLRGVVSGMLAGVWIAGEIGNLSRPASGHVYFTLKDSEAQIRCAYFAGSARRHPATFRQGDRIEVCGKADIYGARGELQLVVSDWRPAGRGELYEAYLRLKARLGAEGLFAQERKRPLRAFVRTAALVTSEKGAAIHDVIRTVARRTPWVRLLLFPALVQGETAPASLIEALRRADAAGADAVLLVRGGGSFEDLYCFNDEGLVRTVTAMRTPVVAGIGHEVDETLASLAADVIASTPTAAAEQLGPEKTFWERRLSAAFAQIAQGSERRLSDAAQGLDFLAERLLTFRSTAALKSERLAGIAEKIRSAALAVLQGAEARCERAGAVISSPARVLEAPAVRLQAAGRSLAAFGAAFDAEPKRALTRAAGLIAAQERRTLGDAEKSLALAAAHLPAPEVWLGAAERRLTAMSQTMAALDPARPLRAGYVRVEKKEGAVLTRAAEAKPGDALSLFFADGRVEATAKTVTQFAINKNKSDSD